ncbi:MAG: hypothetical protein ACRDRS_10350 [Pseudonocardiaceae bacterium]
MFVAGRAARVAERMRASTGFDLAGQLASGLVGADLPDPGELDVSPIRAETERTGRLWSCGVTARPGWRASDPISGQSA